MASGDKREELITGTGTGPFTLAATPATNSLLVHIGGSTFGDSALVGLPIAGKQRYTRTGTSFTIGIARVAADDFWVQYEEA